MTENADINNPGRRKGLAWTLALAVIGLLLAVQLLVIHLTVAYDPAHPFACRVRETIDCNKVALSDQALFWGVPVPAWAASTYLLFMAMAASALVSRRPPYKNAADYALFLAGWSAAYSAYLAYVSALVLGTFCAYCAGLYFVNAALLATTAWSARPLSGFWARRSEDLAAVRKKPLAPVALAAAGVLAAGGLVGYFRTAFEPPLERADVYIEISGDPAIGPADAPITIIEFSDFECPFCARMYWGTVLPMLERYQGRIRHIHKNYPLETSCNHRVSATLHPNACQAAIAAECALILGAHDKFVELMWKSSREKVPLARPWLIELAGDAGMETADFAACLDSDTALREVRRDIEDGFQAGVEATPTFFMEGYKFIGILKKHWVFNILDQALLEDKRD